MKFKNKFLILSLLFSFISCNLFFGLNSNKGAIEENSESLERIDSETSKKRSIRSVLEETAEVVESVLKVVLKPVVVDDKKEEKIVAAEVGNKEVDKKEAEEEVGSKENKEVEEKDIKDLEVKLVPNNFDLYDVNDALYWIKTIKAKKQSGMMLEVLAISGNIELLKRIVSQKYKQEDKANDIIQLLKASQAIVINDLMRSLYEYKEESFVKLEANFKEVKNFLEEAIEKSKK
ncbi:hypothetical protein BDCR2A_01900 [Borrelia duttonii CR2A]|uniref:Lipoprotein n=1 Tax=Borrelia duttonii CR2A TaxID=1432657 RepID=W6TJ67_9SPIR|nr:hypothetical protein [Borrelia duttonii]ETZ17179.1 hypothetical protein BDCR2A_01900 [Borrelia duttonii CR2A]